MLFVLSVLAVVLFVLGSRLLRKLNPQAAVVLGAAAAGAALLALSQCLAIVPAGHVGVVDLFGSVSPHTLKSGLNFINPLARVVKMSVKTQEIKEVMDVPSSEGLTMQLEASVLFHLDPEKAAEIYKTVGPDYVAVLLQPQFRSVTRGVTALFEARALYTSQREQLAQGMATELRKLVEPRGLTIESTPMRRLTLPQRLAAAIEEKLGAEQESQRMQFVLTREKQEAERRRIEAQGIADFQRIVSQGIDERLLKWKGIEATQKLAESQNTKIVIVGAGKDGLPVILGGQ
ncbi:MAG TPA: prohibitin family protein [Vicinamibacteria bacterium]|jgi:regulator of protease activity HflC (stomatin/prohibitin superfamily)|nr:prohibitin family protein [Vicinamibacteria bacterium]